MSRVAAIVPPVPGLGVRAAEGLSVSGGIASGLSARSRGGLPRNVLASVRFFFLSSLATGLREDETRWKVRRSKSGKRTATQVLCNGGFQTLAAALYILMVGGGKDGSPCCSRDVEVSNEEMLFHRFGRVCSLSASVRISELLETHGRAS